MHNEVVMDILLDLEPIIILRQSGKKLEMINIFLQILLLPGQGFKKPHTTGTLNNIQGLLRTETPDC